MPAAAVLDRPPAMRSPLGGPSALDRALAVLERAHRDVERDTGCGSERGREVALVLRVAGCAEPVQAAGLLAGVVAGRPWMLADVRERVDPAVAALVASVPRGAVGSAVGSGSRPRARVARRALTQASTEVVDIALADGIVALRLALAHGARIPRGDRARHEATIAVAARAGHPALGLEAARLLDAAVAPCLPELA
jgi:hypothetical protein